MIDANFKFHPIGQGCFYSGKINFNNRSFNFVYDCGTDSKMATLHNEITTYKTLLKNQKLDLLMISHFHADHVNGVFELLNGITCKNLIIPYYNPIELLLLTATSKSTNEEYFKFLKNPINYFLENNFNVERIILVGGPDYNDEIKEPINPDKIEPNENDDFDEITLNTDFLEDSEEIKIFSKIEQDSGSKLNPLKVKILKEPYRISIPFWEFLFYLKKHDDTFLIEKVTNDINLLLEREKINLSDLFDKEYIDDIKKIYSLYFKDDFNNTSLVTYHGSTKIFSPSLYFKKTLKNKLVFYECNSPQNGTLLTGDIDIRGKRNTQKLLNYYNHYLGKICYFQVPHHGAKANWNFNIPNGLNSFCYYIINHGIGRIHHPSLDVVEYINLNCNDGIVQLNNEAQDFEYGFRFEF